VLQASVVWPHRPDGLQQKPGGQTPSPAPHRKSLVNFFQSASCAGMSGAAGWASAKPTATWVIVQVVCGSEGCVWGGGALAGPPHTRPRVRGLLALPLSLLWLIFSFPSPPPQTRYTSPQTPAFL
jgi:hypothetical protein